MTTIDFLGLPNIQDEKLTYAVIAARYKNHWIFCRHGERDTWEIPGGHRDPGEGIDDAARRELYEETGAVEFDLHPIEIYSVTKDGCTAYGKLYFADIKNLSPLPDDSEIDEIVFGDTLPNNLTYPDIQPQLFARAITAGDITVRDVVQYDLDDLLSLYLFLHDKKKVDTPQVHEVWQDILQNPNYHIIVGELDGVLVSSVTLIVIKNLTHGACPYALIENVVTHEDHRKKGYAARLIHCAVEKARLNGCYKIMLNTGSKKEETLHFYEHCGFNRKEKTAFIRWL